MRKISLIGDSIREIGYGTKLPELMGGDYVVYQPPGNCRFSKHTLRGVLSDWKKDLEGSDIIHWNNGLWDVLDYGDGVFTPIEEYVANMVRIAETLEKYAPKVIFATTTPVTPRYSLTNLERICHYNAVLVPELEKRGIIINDLYSFVYPNMDTFIRKDDNIHLTEDGILACAEVVKKVILENI